MKLRLLICLLLAALLAVQPARAADVTVTVDGEALPSETLVVDGMTYVQLTALLEAMGGWETDWDPVKRTAISDTDLFRLTVPIKYSYVLADGFTYESSGAALIYNGRTYVPLRSVATLLGAQVDFVSWSVPVTVSTGQSMAYTDEDLYWLSRVISAESGGESLLGQLAVGNVVLNRVASRQYPDTIREVIFDTRDAVQFEPVANGTIYNEPTEQSVLAARLVLNGARVVGSCMYFFNPSLSQGTWIRENCNYYTTIGCHRFYS